MDELAHLAGVDPVAFRLSVLGSTPRLASVLKLAAEKGGWGTPLPPNVGRGVACVTAQEKKAPTWTASVVEAQVDPTTGRVRVRRVTCAVDCGIVVNPDGARADRGLRALRGVERAEGVWHRGQRRPRPVELPRLPRAANGRGPGRRDPCGRLHGVSDRPRRARHHDDRARALERDLRGDRRAGPERAAPPVARAEGDSAESVAKYSEGATSRARPTGRDGPLRDRGKRSREGANLQDRWRGRSPRSNRPWSYTRLS